MMILQDFSVSTTQLCFGVGFSSRSLGLVFQCEYMFEVMGCHSVCLPYGEVSYLSSSAVNACPVMMHLQVQLSDDCSGCQ